MDWMDEANAYRDLIMTNIEYDILCERHGEERMDEVVELMLEAVISKRPYWESNVEMTARAFACYVKDRLPYQSDYLVGHAESCVTIAFDKSGHSEVIRAYPQGEERKAINAAFDEIVADLKLERIFTHTAEITALEASAIVLPLYLYDHSALAMSTDSFIGRAVHAEWDSGQVGWIYVSKEDIRAEYQVDRITPSVREQAENRLKDEVRIYDAYLRGECYGYELYKNGELTDSCWGFVGSFDEAIKDIAEYLPDECKGMTEKLAEVSDPASMVKTLLKHARIQVEQAAKDMERKPREQVLGVEL